MTWNENQMTRPGSTQFEVPKYKLCKSDENFWKQSVLFYKTFSGKTDFFDDANLKQNLTRPYWNFVEKQNNKFLRYTYASENNAIQQENSSQAIRDVSFSWAIPELYPTITTTIMFLKVFV